MVVKRLAMYVERDISAYEFKKSSDTWFDEGHGVFLYGKDDEQVYIIL